MISSFLDFVFVWPVQFITCAMKATPSQSEIQDLSAGELHSQQTSGISYDHLYSPLWLFPLPPHRRPDGHPCSLLLRPPSRLQVTRGSQKHDYQNNCSIIHPLTIHQHISSACKHLTCPNFLQFWHCSGLYKNTFTPNLTFLNFTCVSSYSSNISKTDWLSCLFISTTPGKRHTSTPPVMYRMGYLAPNSNGTSEITLFTSALLRKSRLSTSYDDHTHGKLSINMLSHTVFSFCSNDIQEIKTKPLLVTDRLHLSSCILYHLHVIKQISQKCIIVDKLQSNRF